MEFTNRLKLKYFTFDDFAGDHKYLNISQKLTFGFFPVDFDIILKASSTERLEYQVFLYVRDGFPPYK